MFRRKIAGYHKQKHKRLHTTTDNVPKMGDERKRTLCFSLLQLFEVENDFDKWNEMGHSL